jgi:hypothetical protein
MTPILRKVTSSHGSLLLLSCGHRIKATGAAGGWVACSGCAAGRGGR